MNAHAESGWQVLWMWSLLRVQGTEIKVEADENLQPYIITEMEDDVLVIRMRSNIRFINSERLKIYITTDRLEQLTLSGSGNISGTNKFTGSDHLKLRGIWCRRLTARFQYPRTRS